jgi:hypothetical protein
MPEAALLGAAYALFHVPDLVRYGSKPSRQIARDPEQLRAISSHLRSFASAVAYPPNQAFIGNLAPEALEHIERPRFRQPMESARTKGQFGSILDQATFYARLAEADVFDLVHLDDSAEPPPGSAPLGREGLLLRPSPRADPGVRQPDSGAGGGCRGRAAPPARRSDPRRWPDGQSSRTFPSATLSASSPGAWAPLASR